MQGVNYMLWDFLLVVFLAGSLGGLLNALLSDKGLLVPSYDRNANVVVPGFLGNVLIGGFAAAISWGLYGPFAAEFMLGGQGPLNSILGLSLSGIVGGVIAGIGGARIITSEVEKTMLRASGSHMAAMNNNSAMAAMFALDPPAKVLTEVMKQQSQDKEGTAPPSTAIEGPNVKP